MATDIEFSSCSSSIVDSGFESVTKSTPRPPPRKKRIKKCEISNNRNEKKEKTWSSIFSHHINKFSSLIEKVIFFPSLFANFRLQ